jgi:hypothetical protein
MYTAQSPHVKQKGYIGMQIGVWRRLGLGVTRSAVSDWTNHRGLPSLAKGLELQSFLAEQRCDRQ